MSGGFRFQRGADVTPACSLQERGFRATSQMLGDAAHALQGIAEDSESEAGN